MLLQIMLLQMLLEIIMLLQIMLLQIMLLEMLLEIINYKSIELKINSKLSKSSVSCHDS